jgi:hypothetical protein
MFCADRCVLVRLGDAVGGDENDRTGHCARGRAWTDELLTWTRAAAKTRPPTVRARYTAPLG